MMVLYHLSANIIGRSSGRSAVGASAYRMGGILRSIAYRSGEELYDETGEIVHDYTRKGGIVHSEILLPEGAPPEYADRQILWNAVDAREKRKDSQLAREIVVALQREFALEENLEVLYEYVKENFVDKGMIADLNIHNKNDGNPHAHIMLTTRHVSSEGFGLKNRGWSKKDVFLEWRKSWADINNCMFERKGMDERIDHRSYEAQGIDKEPQVHLGYEASEMEKRGIHTKRGDHNREVQRRNAERKAQKTAEREALKIVQEQEEIALSAEKDTPISSENPKNGEHTAEKTAIHLNKIKKHYTALEKELYELIPKRNEIRDELPRLTYRAEQIDEHAKNIETLQGKLAELQEMRQNLSFLQWTRKKEVDETIKRTEREVMRAEVFFNNRFGIAPAQATEEIKRIQEKISEKQTNLNTKNARILEIINTQDKTLTAYHTQKLLAETRPDKHEITQYLEKLYTPPQTVRERLLHERIDRRLNIIPEENFQNVIDKLPPEYAKTLTAEREKTKAIKHKQEKTRNRTIDRSR